MLKNEVLISKTTHVEEPMPYNLWCHTYKVGCRVPKLQPEMNMYLRGEYDMEKLVKMLRSNKEKPKSLYERIFKR